MKIVTSAKSQERDKPAYPMRDLAGLYMNPSNFEWLVRALVSQSGRCYPSDFDALVINRLLPVIRRDISWLAEMTRFNQGFTIQQPVGSINSTLAKSLENVFVPGTTIGVNTAESDRLSKVYDFTNSTLNKFEVHIDLLGEAVVASWLFYDLIRKRDDMYAITPGFFDCGHLFGSLGSALFITTRETGGKLRAGEDGREHFLAHKEYEDVDGVNAYGLVSFRPTNPYLLSLIEYFHLLELVPKNPSIDNLLSRFGKMRPWLQYYISLLANRVRCRNGQCSALAHLRPLSDFPINIKAFIRDHDYRPDVVEIYMGNLGRLRNRASVEQDISRVGRSSAFRFYKEDLNRFGASSPY